jgi:hypothetical protein
MSSRLLLRTSPLQWPSVPFNNTLPSAKPLSVHVDGHPIGTTPVQFRVLPKALKVVAGVESHSRGGIRKRGPMNAWRYPRQWLSAALLAGLLVMGLGAALFVYIVDKVHSLQ